MYHVDSQDSRQQTPLVQCLIVIVSHGGLRFVLVYRHRVCFLGPYNKRLVPWGLSALASAYFHLHSWRMLD